MEVDMDYKSNSHRSKEEQQEPEHKVEKVVTGEVKTKKRTGISKFADEFISEDARNVKSYIFRDVLIPAIKKTISDIITNGIDMLLYGERGGRSRDTSASKISYRSYYDSGRKDPGPIRARNSYSYDEIIINNRGEAEDVLTRMDELISRYGVVSVADFYDLVGVQCSYTDNRYGWTDLRSADVMRVRDGYQIKLPKAMPID